MKILYLCTYYHRAMVFRDSMNYLEKRGHSVVAFNAVARGTKIDNKYKPIMDEKVIHNECFYTFDRFFFHLKQWKIQKALESDTDIRSYDIIHSHTLFNGGWAIYQLHRKYGVPYVVSVRNTDLNVFLKIPMFKRIARKVVDSSKGVLFLSAAYRDKLLDLCYSGERKTSVLEKCDVIPNGLEDYWLDNIAEAKLDIHHPLELLCVGKIDKNKNIETTLRVVDQLNEEGITTHLTVIGQVLDNNIKELIDKNRETTLVSYMTKEELIKYYAISDIFVMPSYHETFGRVYAEAMTQGVPVIYTRGQGFDGTFPDGAIGYSVKANDVAEIVNKVKEIIDNYRSLSRNCIENCRIFNWSDIAECLERLYEKTV